MDGLLKLKEKHEIIGDVRGKGLMIAVELVKDRKTKEPLEPEKIANIFELTKDFGLLVGKGGISGNVFRMAPSMNITEDDCDFALHVLDKSFQQ
jgi:alanine-glyoxylate transaminase / (R)-3-amino-2-methylpropionate-pyruvate transaminase